MKVRTFEVKTREEERHVPMFYAQVHCVGCKSTFGSGEWFPSVRHAIEVARESIEGHETSCAKYNEVTNAPTGARKEEEGVC